MKISIYTVKGIAAGARKRLYDGADYETVLFDTLKELELCGDREMIERGLLDPVYSAAAAEFGILEHTLRGRRRTRRVAQARHAVVLMTSRLGLTNGDIAKAMERDPTTITHSIDTARKMLATDTAFATTFANMERRLSTEYELDPVGVAS